MRAPHHPRQLQRHKRQHSVQRPNRRRQGRPVRNDLGGRGGRRRHGVRDRQYGHRFSPGLCERPTTLVSFNGTNGSTPYSGLIADAKRDQFGTSSAGGADGDGTAFDLANTGPVSHPVYASAPTTLVSFNGTNGSEPLGG